MKIAHVVQFLGIGGLEKVLWMLIKEQQKDGHEVVLYVYDYEQSWVKDFQEDGILVKTQFQKAPGFDLKVSKYFAKELREFDIIHSHDLNPMIYLSIAKLKSKLKLQSFPKLIQTTHGMENINSSKKDYLFEKFSSKAYDAIIGVSENFKKFYLELGVNPKKVFNIDNGTFVPDEIPIREDANFLKEIKKEFDIPNQNKIWVTIARVFPLKDQALLNKVMEFFPEKTLLIVGPSGDDKYFEILRNELNSNVRMIGSRTDIKELLQASELFLSASHHEGIPISVLEAGANGTPCVLSDIPGHRTIELENSPEAIFFKVSNLEDLKFKLTELTEEKMTTLRDNLYKTVAKNFSARNMHIKVMDVYNNA